MEGAATLEMRLRFLFIRALPPEGTSDPLETNPEHIDVISYTLTILVLFFPFKCNLPGI